MRLGMEYAVAMRLVRVVRRWLRSWIRSWRVDHQRVVDERLSLPRRQTQQTGPCWTCCWLVANAGSLSDLKRNPGLGEAATSVAGSLGRCCAQKSA